MKYAAKASLTRAKKTVRLRLSVALLVVLLDIVFCVCFCRQSYCVPVSRFDTELLFSGDSPVKPANDGEGAGNDEIILIFAPSNDGRRIGR